MAKWFGMPRSDDYEGLNLKYLPINRAYVIANTSFENVGVYSVDRNCFHCPYKLIQTLQANEASTWQVDTSVETSWRILNTADWDYVAHNYKAGLICQENPTLGEFGIYRLNVGSCDLATEVAPINPYLPLLLCGLILLVSGVSYGAIKWMFKRRRAASKEEEAMNITVPEDKMRGLHLLRGLLMAIIIFSTAGGGGYPFFYNKFKGISVQEVAFCVLAWTVGVHVPQAIDAEISKGRKRWFVLGAIFLRAIILKVMDNILSATYPLSISPTILWAPVLRIWTAYILAATVYVLTAKRLNDTEKFGRKIFNSIVTMAGAWMIIIVVLTGLSVFMTIFEKVNCFGDVFHQTIEANYSITDESVSVQCENNYTTIRNTFLLDVRTKILDVNNYVGYSSGILGMFSTTLFTFIGMKTGVILAHIESKSERLKLWGTWGTIFGVVGVLLISVPQAVTTFNLLPIGTIFLISTGSTYLLMLISWLASQQQRKISPLYSLGYSFLPILFGHLLLSNTLPFTLKIDLKYHILYLIQNFWTIVLWMVVAFLLTRKNWRISV